MGIVKDLKKRWGPSTLISNKPAMAVAHQIRQFLNIKRESTDTDIADIEDAIQKMQSVRKKQKGDKPIIESIDLEQAILLKKELFQLFADQNRIDADLKKSLEAERKADLKKSLEAERKKELTEKCDKIKQNIQSKNNQFLNATGDLKDNLNRFDRALARYWRQQNDISTFEVADCGKKGFSITVKNAWYSSNAHSKKNIQQFAKEIQEYFDQAFGKNCTFTFDADGNCNMIVKDTDKEELRELLNSMEEGTAGKQAKRTLTVQANSSDENNNDINFANLDELAAAPTTPTANIPLFEQLNLPPIAPPALASPTPPTNNTAPAPVVPALVVPAPDVPPVPAPDPDLAPVPVPPASTFLDTDSDKDYINSNGEYTGLFR